MPISDIGNLLSQQYALGILNDKVNDMSRESSSGKKSTTVAGLGPNGAASAITYRNEDSALTAYTANLNTAKARLSTTDTALTSITSTARTFVATLQAQLQDTTPSATILSGSATTQLEDIIDKLNTNVGGTYVFSGQNFDSTAYNGTAALMSNIGSVVTAAMADPTSTTASISAAAQAVSGTGLGVSSAAVNGGTVNIKADDNASISIGLTANNPGFADIMRGMAIVANLPQPTTPAEQTTYWSAINSAISLINGGATTVDNAQAALGDQAANVDSLITQHSDTSDNLQTYYGSVEDVDMADAATKFSALQTQLQTSYSLISSMKDITLVNYL
jgi:flagellar hook-associated protein 3 FlgL